MTSPAPTVTPTYTPNAKYVLMLGALCALPAITTDMYLPSLTEVAADLSATDAAVQFTMSGMLIGGAVGQLVIGPLSDRFGRRLPLIVGISLHILTSLLCSIAPGIEVLIGLRMLQGFCNAAASVVAIAVIRDRFTGSAAARLLSRLMLVIGVAPLLAPSVGQVIAHHFDWRAVFLALALVGAALLTVVCIWMPETLPRERRRSKADHGALRGYGQLLKDRKFLALAVLPGLAMAVIMSYVVGSPFVLREQFGLTGAQFSAVFALNGIALVGSAQVNAALVHRMAPARILRVAIVVQLGFAFVLLGIVLTGAGGLVGLLVGLWLVLGMQGMIPSNASVLALAGYGHMAGTAAALMGAMQAGIAGLVSPLVGVLGSDAVAMVTVMIVSIATSVLVLVLATPVYRKGGWRTI